MSPIQSNIEDFGIVSQNNFSNKSFKTRYRGSKQKIVNWIWDQISDLKFDTFLDAMGGTGTVAYKAKKEGKTVIYNDYMKYNYYVGKTLIENNNTKLSDSDIDFILKEDESVYYPSFIQDTFKDIYFTDDENQLIDIMITNINRFQNEYKKAAALYCLFQACIIKRPYNLFHRKNLYVRFNDVKRSFGNKTTWDKPFEYYIRKFAEEVNECVFSNSKNCKALNFDAFDIPGKYDLVYIDTPYIPRKGEIVDYRDAYHFLEGLTDYHNWSEHINTKRKHKPLQKEYSVWNDKKAINDGFDKLFYKFKDSILVVSYRDDGIPSEDEILELLRKYKKTVLEVRATDFKYVLSKRESKELLFIAY